MQSSRSDPVLQLRKDLPDEQVVQVEFRGYEGKLRIEVSDRASHSPCISIIPDEHGITPSSGPNPGISQMRRAVDYALRASWTLRTRIRQGRSSTIRVPLSQVEPPRSGQHLSMPTLGGLIRPLLCVHRCIPALRPFQAEGVKWLQKRNRAILADDMGLGKTLQVIAASRELVYEGTVRQVVVVSPRTLVAVWEDEIGKWAPELAAVAGTRWTGSREDFWRRVRGRTHYVLCHYEFMRASDEAMECMGMLDLLVLDEVHRVRNEGSQVTTGVRNLARKRIWALTGTPIERDVQDLATILSVVEPGRMSSEFAELGESAVRTTAARYLLRRRKSQVLSQLPEVIEKVHRLVLGEKQRAAYESLHRTFRDSAGRGGGLKLLGDLLRVCDFDPTSKQSVKIDRMLELVRGAALQGEKSVVFSYTVDPLREAQRMLRTHKIQAELVTGDLSLTRRNYALKRFRNEASCTVLLLSLRVGSEGLTLTEANHVVFLNRWWNPSSNNQARDRVVRFGQNRVVFVHYLMCSGTVEEQLLEILQHKSDVFADVVDRLSEGMATDQSPEGVEDLVARLRGRSDDGR